MSGYSVPSLQRAIIAQMRADVDLTAVIGQRIYDTAPPDAGYPFLTIQEITSEAWDSSTTDGASVNVNLSIFAQGESARADVQRHAALLIAALGNSAPALVVPGHTVVLFRHVRTLVMRTPDDGGGAHAVVMFTALTESETPSTGY